MSKIFGGKTFLGIPHTHTHTPLNKKKIPRFPKNHLHMVA